MKNFSIAVVVVVAALSAGAMTPVRGEEKPTPPNSVGKIVLGRPSALEGLGFFSGQAANAANLRGRASSLAQASFASPEEAMAALVAALEKGDHAALTAVLGAGNEQLLSTGNDLADAMLRETFFAEYRTRHSLAARGDGKVELLVGVNEWPLPIPVVAIDGKWYLDGSAGADEILRRHIGHNELGAIAVCRTFIEAQKKYAAEGRDGNPPGIFAARVHSEPGLHNGLHWRTAGGEATSPSATAVTGIPYVPALPKKMLYDLTPQPGHGQKPVHGYYYRMLFAQGAHAAGGAKEYTVDGHLSGGIALLARPADYGNSSLMTFIVNIEGVVYEKDLGADTTDLADSIQSFDPDSSWSIVPLQAP